MYTHGTPACIPSYSFMFVHFFCAGSSYETTSKLPISANHPNLGGNVFLPHPSTSWCTRRDPILGLAWWLRQNPHVCCWCPTFFTFLGVNWTTMLSLISIHLHNKTSIKLRFGASDPSFPTRQARDFACRQQDHGFLGQSVLVHGKELGSQLVSCGVPLRKMGKTISSKIISYSDSIFVGQKRSESHCFGNATWVPTPVPASWAIPGFQVLGGTKAAELAVHLDGNLAAQGLKSVHAAEHVTLIDGWSSSIIIISSFIIL